MADIYVDLKKYSFVGQVGERGLKLFCNSFEVIYFLGEIGLSIFRFFIGKSRMRSNDLLLSIQQAGPQSFWLVTLISILVGIILAFIGSVQLQQFGAQIYVANLVGIGITREMGAIMVGIILAGRSGAAFAAELGAMVANEEIDALKTFAINEIDLLVLPRVLALFFVAPLLTVYADILGILGGAIVSFLVFDLSPRLFWEQTLIALRLNDFTLGIFKGVAFGGLVAFAGTMCGLHAGKDSVAVGNATTCAVVAGIVLIVIADAIFSIAASIIGV